MKHRRRLAAIVGTIVGAALLIQLGSAAGAGADTTKTFRIAFAVGNQETATVEPGAAPSHCTKHASKATVNTGSGVDTTNLAMKTTTSGSCASQASYETWTVKVTGPYFNGSGHVRFGQKSQGDRFTVSCAGRWSGVACHTIPRDNVRNPGNDDVQIGAPGCQVRPGTKCRVTGYSVWWGQSTVHFLFRKNGRRYAEMANVGMGTCGYFYPPFRHSGNGTIGVGITIKNYDGGKEVTFDQPSGSDPCIMDISVRQ